MTTVTRIRRSEWERERSKALEQARREYAELRHELRQAELREAAEREEAQMREFNASDQWMTADDEEHFEVVKVEMAADDLTPVRADPEAARAARHEPVTYTPPPLGELARPPKTEILHAGGFVITVPAIPPPKPVPITAKPVPITAKPVKHQTRAVDLVSWCQDCDRLVYCRFMGWSIDGRWCCVTCAGVARVPDSGLQTFAELPSTIAAFTDFDSATDTSTDTAGGQGPDRDQVSDGVVQEGPDNPDDPGDGLVDWGTSTVHRH